MKGEERREKGKERRKGKQTKGKERKKESVLGLARTGLIFTGLQEGAQPGGGGLTPPGQTEPGIPYHVTSRWVPVGGSGAAGRHSRLGRAQRRSGFGRAAVVRFVVVFFSLFVSLLFLFSLCLLFC